MDILISRYLGSGLPGKLRLGGWEWGERAADARRRGGDRSIRVDCLRCDGGPNVTYTRFVSTHNPAVLRPRARRAAVVGGNREFIRFGGKPGDRVGQIPHRWRSRERPNRQKLPDCPANPKYNPARNDGERKNAPAAAPGCAPRRSCNGEACEGGDRAIESRSSGGNDGQAALIAVATPEALTVATEGVLEVQVTMLETFLVEG